MKKIAHRKEDNTEQLLCEHLENTAMLTEQFASDFDSASMGYLAGLFHDIGKYSAYFQNRIRDPESFAARDHATAGAKETEFMPLAFAIAGHHGGIPDGGSSVDSKEIPSLCGRMKKSLEDYSAWKSEINPPPVQIPYFLQENTSQFSWAFYTRMLFSSLVDADFIDTETFMQGEKPRGDFDSIPQLSEKLKAHFAKMEISNSELNQIRGEILDSCIAKANCDTGLFSLTVPTGGGKTLSSLAFALEHAKKKDLKRVIYVIPYTSIIDQTAEVFSSIFGENQVIEHHSSVVFVKDSEGDLDSIENKKRLACENWDAPIIITTAVQFFESLFANKPSQCRKLHNIAKSVVIFDEAQTLPVPYLRPCVAAISELVKYYHCSSVLCTATQPELDELFQEHSVSIQEMLPNTAPIFKKLKRCTIEDYGSTSWTELGTELSQLSQVLVIVNHRKSAKLLWETLPEEGNYCLSTLLYPKHRKKLLKEIRQRLKEGLTCRVISTCLIEAGVDLDFPLVFREKAGLDSLLQAAGRCNREGKRPLEESKLYYFKVESLSPQSFQQNVDAFDEVVREFQDVTDLEAISSYFRLLWYLKGKESLDQKQILNGIERGIAGNLCPFRQVAQMFQFIESGTISIYIPLEEGGKWVEQLKSGKVSRDLFRQLGQFSINVYPYQLSTLLQAGTVAETSNGEFILSDMSIYNSDTGLSLETETGKALFI